MKKFNCNCYGKDAICNDRHSSKITVWKFESNPDEEGKVYFNDVNYCPVCGTKLTQLED